MSACPDTTNVKLADVLDGMELLARNTYEPTPSRGFGTDWQKREAASVGGLFHFKRNARCPLFYFFTHGARVIFCPLLSRHSFDFLKGFRTIL